MGVKVALQRRSVQQRNRGRVRNWPHLTSAATACQITFSEGDVRGQERVNAGFLGHQDAQSWVFAQAKPNDYLCSDTSLSGQIAPTMKGM